MSKKTKPAMSLNDFLEVVQGYVDDMGEEPTNENLEKRAKKSKQWEPLAAGEGINTTDFVYRIKVLPRFELEGDKIVVGDGQDRYTVSREIGLKVLRIREAAIRRCQSLRWDTHLNDSEVGEDLKEVYNVTGFDVSCQDDGGVRVGCQFFPPSEVKEAIKLLGFKSEKAKKAKK